jgi:hypothetical protein
MNPELPDPNTDQTTDFIHEVMRTMGDQHVADAAGKAVVPGAIETPQAAPSHTEITHDRPKPQRWDEIVELASSLPVFRGAFEAPFLARPIQMYETDSVDTLRRRLNELSDDEIEELRYHAIGPVTLDLAQALRDPSMREQMIDAAAESIYAMWPSGGSNTFKPEDISVGLGGVEGFDEPITNAFHNLPPHLQLLNDVLFWNQNERKAALQRGGSPEDYISESNGIFAEGQYAVGQCLPDIVAVTLSGATLVIERSLKLRGAYLSEHDPTFPADASAQQIIDRTDMDSFNLTVAAQRAAGLRLDEFNANLERYIGLDGNGNVVFHGKRLPRTRDLRPAAMPETGSTVGFPLHTRRLRCPAIFVEELIPDVVSSLLSVIKKTDQMVQEGEKPFGHP